MTLLFTEISVVKVSAFLMPVTQAPIPTGQWEEGQVTPAHAVRCIIAEELWVEGTWTFYSRHKHPGRYILRKMLCSLYLQVSITALCSEGDTVSISQGYLKSSLLLKSASVHQMCRSVRDPWKIISQQLNNKVLRFNETLWFL